jgi:Family of unknown function (DUF6529)
VATVAHAGSTPRGTRSARWLVVSLSGFALAALTAGLLAQAELDTGGGYFDLFFSDPIHLKAWFATAAGVLAITELLTAAWIFRKLPWARPPWVPALHRWTGRLAFAAKVLVVRLHRFPVWVLPTLGGLLFGVLAAVWYTSALWLFRLVGLGI